MSAIIFLPGRPTTDPQIMQAKNSNTTYTTLDISCPSGEQTETRRPYSIPAISIHFWQTA